ncbi:putative xyloglucan endotransglucosylase/hydrolase protein 8 [Acorus calamus]|uniref:Xyloglucan endotransglucosylase/hydrolase protein 8 n=1 Tax=Acorus calamus TaxID=4465 RepID=A0AAV9DUL6_ACOCL|nr:putative xyloglucan endotransglucosylase/hydrolase protein 8 [Acorus calamus]
MSSDPHHRIHHTEILSEIAVDYTPSACDHHPPTGEIRVAYDDRGGARWRSTRRFRHGTFSARIRCPSGNTSGLNFNLYLSSLEGHKSQDEIDFEFLGKDRTIVQTNYYVSGLGNHEEHHDLGFDASEDFHEYVIKWTEREIEWLIDGRMVRRVERRDGEDFPEKPMFLYSSVWDASYIDEGRWTGVYDGSDAPYVCTYRDVRVPVWTAVTDDEAGEEVVVAS